MVNCQNALTNLINAKSIAEQAAKIVTERQRIAVENAKKANISPPSPQEAMAAISLKLFGSIAPKMICNSNQEFKRSQSYPPQSSMLYKIKQHAEDRLSSKYESSTINKEYHSLKSPLPLNKQLANVILIDRQEKKSLENPFNYQGQEPIYEEFDLPRNSLNVPNTSTPLHSNRSNQAQSSFYADPYKKKEHVYEEIQYATQQSNRRSSADVPSDNISAKSPALQAALLSIKDLYSVPIKIKTLAQPDLLAGLQPDNKIASSPSTAKLAPIYSEPFDSSVHLAIEPQLVEASQQRLNSQEPHYAYPHRLSQATDSLISHHNMQDQVTSPRVHYIDIKDAIYAESTASQEQQNTSFIKGIFSNVMRFFGIGSKTL